MKLLPILFLVFTSTGFIFSQQPKMLSQEQVTELYKRLYQTSEIGSTGWKGSTSSCTSGTIDQSIYKKAEDRINFFRLAVGLNEIKHDPSFDQLAQDAALFTKTNNVLTHTPDKSMKCYSESAYSGCNKSCLAFMDFKNFPLTAFITGYIQDYGDDNYFIGHRKWLLYTKLSSFSYGATDNTDAVLTANGINYSEATSVDYVAYPWNGYVPVHLIFPKWSFSIPEDKKVDFSNTTISMFDDKGNPIPLKKLQLYENYLDHTVVWTVNGLFTDYEMKYGQNNLEQNGWLNRPIKVKIKNVKVNDEIKNYEYVVQPFKINAGISNNKVVNNNNVVFEDYEVVDENVEEYDDKVQMFKPGTGKNMTCDKLFIDLLIAKGLKDKNKPGTCNCYASGYLEDLECYYVSYSYVENGETYDATELFELDNDSKITDFTLDINAVAENQNPNQSIIWDKGELDTKQVFIVLINKEHLSVYKKNRDTNEFELEETVGCLKGNGKNKSCQFFYDRENQIIIRRSYGIQGHEKGYDERYMIVSGTIIKMN